MALDYDIIVKGNNLKIRDGFLALANITLILADDGPMLFDTGHFCNRPALLKGLAAHGLGPADICAVFLSHLHFDHCNNIDLFPQAKVYVSKREWEYAGKPHDEDILIPWMIHEQLAKHDVELIEGEGEIAPGISYFPAPGHTPGSFALLLETESKGRVVLAGDAIKYAKETLTRRSDMPFDTVENGTASITRIMEMADRIVPGHFPELIKTENGFVWEEAAELPLLIR